MNKGETVLIPFPFTDLSGNKKPARTDIGEYGIRFNYSFITSQLKWQEEFDVLLQSTSENGLKKTSLPRLSKLTTIDKYLVIGRLGNLSKNEMTTVNNNLVKLFKLA